MAAISAHRRRSENLPIELTSFVGRERLLSDVIGALTREASPCRLLTLTGTGGTGKTRVAVQAARAAGDRLPDGVVLVSLAAITHTTLVIPTIAQTLDHSRLPGGPRHRWSCVQHEAI